jgi:hypothetical protein
MKWNVEYGQTRVRNLKIVGIRSSKTNKIQVTGVEIDGQMAVPSPRFWKSLLMQFGISESVLRYFDHAEVFERISAMSPDDALRYCIGSDDDGNKRLLGIRSVKEIRHRVLDFFTVAKPSMN